MNYKSMVKQEVDGLLSDGRGISLGAVAITWGLLIGTRMVYPVIIPFLQADYGLSLTAAGLLVTVLWFFASVGQLPGGVLADRYSERTLMATGAITVAVALGLVISASSTIVLFLATAIWGLGHSLYPIARITFLSNLYSERLGSALGVTMATGDIGQTVLPPVAAILAAGIAWQAGLGFVSPLLVIFGIAILVTSTRDGSVSSSSSTQTIRNRVAVFSELRSPEIGFMTGILFLYLFIWQSFTAFYPTYLTTVKGFSPSAASLLFGFFFAVGVVVKPIAGAAYDRIGMRKSLIAVFVPSIAGFALLPIMDSLWTLVGITALISTMLGSGAVTQSFLAESFSDDMKGTGLGVVRTFTASLASAGPVLFGAIGDYGYFDEGYLVLAVVVAVVVALTLRIPDTEHT